MGVVEWNLKEKWRVHNPKTRHGIIDPTQFSFRIYANAKIFANFTHKKI